MSVNGEPGLCRPCTGKLPCLLTNTVEKCSGQLRPQTKAQNPGFLLCQKTDVAKITVPHSSAHKAEGNALSSIGPDLRTGTSGFTTGVCREKEAECLSVVCAWRRAGCSGLGSCALCSGGSVGIVCHVGVACAFRAAGSCSVRAEGS